MERIMLSIASQIYATQGCQIFLNSEIKEVQIFI